MLNRSKLLNFLSMGKYNDSSGMLTCCTTDTRTALHDPVNLTVPFSLAPLFKIILHISESCFLRKSTDGSCFKGVPLSENNLCIFMCHCLIFTGEIQVNIRLLVAFKSQECLKGNIEPVFLHHGSAFGACFIRHVAPHLAHKFFHIFRVKITVFTVGAYIMGRQRIYLCDSRHCCGKG